MGTRGHLHPEAFDHLATMVAVLRPDGRCTFVNAAFEAVLGLPRRTLQRGQVWDWFVDASALRATFEAVHHNEYATGRLEAQLRRPPGSTADPLPVHAIVTQIDRAGELTIKGITRQVTLRVSHFHCMVHPLLRRQACGANADATIRRSDFGLGKFAPLVGDTVTITIAIEALRSTP
jgi:PAS domain-containing protein